MPTDTITKPHHLSCAPGRAARELGLKRGEFDLAVHLGHIRTLPDEGGGGRRVARSEIVTMGEPVAGMHDRELLVPLLRAGTVVGRESLDEVRGRHRRAVQELPSTARQLSRGDPAIPTEFVTH